MKKNKLSILRKSLHLVIASKAKQSSHLRHCEQGEAIFLEDCRGLRPRNDELYDSSIKFQPGAALLTVLLFISFISVLIFGISRQALSEMTLNRGSNDSIGAYYAAEAGLQDGLLRFKIDRNYQTLSPEDVTLNPKAKYNLAMVWQTAKNPLGQTGNITLTGKIFKDQPMELVVDYGAANDNVNVVFNIKCAVFDANNTQLAEKANSIEFLEINPAGGITNRFVDKCPDAATGIPRTVVRNTVKKIRINAFFDNATPNYYLQYTATFPGDISIDSGFTTITSIGSVGDNVRKLELKVDRTTGKAVGFLDYALYSAGIDSIK